MDHSPEIRRLVSPRNVLLALATAGAIAIGVPTAAEAADNQQAAGTDTAGPTPEATKTPLAQTTDGATGSQPSQQNGDTTSPGPSTESTTSPDQPVSTSTAEGPAPTSTSTTPNPGQSPDNQPQDAGTSNGNSTGTSSGRDLHSTLQQLPKTGSTDTSPQPAKDSSQGTTPDTSTNSDSGYGGLTISRQAPSPATSPETTAPQSTPTPTETQQTGGATPEAPTDPPRDPKTTTIVGILRLVPSQPAAADKGPSTNSTPTTTGSGQTAPTSPETGTNTGQPSQPDTNTYGGLSVDAGQASPEAQGTGTDPNTTPSAPSTSSSSGSKEITVTRPAGSSLAGAVKALPSAAPTTGTTEGSLQGAAGNTPPADQTPATADAPTGVGPTPEQTGSGYDGLQVQQQPATAPENPSSGNPKSDTPSTSTPNTTPSTPEVKVDASLAEQAAQIMANRKGTHWENVGITYRFYLSDGFNPTAIAGIVGNGIIESRNPSAGLWLDPQRRQEGGGPGTGMFQWEDSNGASHRWNDLVDWAGKHGLDPWAIETQLKFSVVEMKQRGIIDNLNNASSVERAAYIFEKRFEGAGKPAMARRNEEANRVNDEFTRIVAALKAGQSIS